MSIFEPIPRGSHSEREDDDDDEDDGFPAAGESFDPRSIMIAGVVVVGIVVLGLVVSNAAEREQRSRPLVPSVQVDPGAAAVEQLDATQSASPTTAPTASPSPTATPADTADGSRIEPVGIDAAKADRKPKSDDKPGRGNGRGRD